MEKSRRHDFNMSGIQINELWENKKKPFVFLGDKLHYDRNGFLTCV